MNTYRIIFLIAISVLLLSSCKKDKTEDPGPTGPVTTTTIHISGVVLDASGFPIQGVEVVCGTKTATTDYNGAYAFFNFVSPIEKCVITFNKTGYFKGVRTFRPQAGKFMPIEVTLLPYSWTNASTAYFNSSLDYNMSISSTGCEIDFPANNWIVASTGATYSGDITVHAAYLDPTDVNFGKYAYGGLMMGVDSASTSVYLEPLTGIVVEIYGASGEKLNLDPSSKAAATITMQIPAGIVNPPSTVDLWDFNLVMGVAGAGGSAAKNGDKYVSQAQHFSYWSCEKICSGNPAVINGHVTDGTNSLSGVPVIVGSSLVFTDVNGNFSQKVPSGILVSVGIKQGYLGVYQTPLSVGPLTNDEVYQIPSDFVVPSVQYITGQLVNCNSTGVQGHVIFNSSSYGITSANTDATGHFTLAVNSMMTYGTLIANGNGVTEEQYLSIPSFPHNTGQIILCPPIPLGPNQITINGSTYNTWDYVECGIYGGSSTSIYMNNNSTGDHVSISFIGTSTGSYTCDGTSVYVNGTIGGVQFQSTTGTISVTQFGNVGQLINGTFNCTCSVNGAYSGKFSGIREDFTFKKE